MTRNIKTIVTASADHLIADTAGIIALAALLIGALYLPVVF